jgi:myo-inositol-1(or 4)-monophosphatase
MSNGRLNRIIGEAEEFVPDMLIRLADGYMGKVLGERTVTRKSEHRRDMVTAQDLEAEQLVRDCLEKRFSEIGFVGEELASSTGAEETLHWIIDAIDGTLNYASGYPHYASSVALALGPEVMFGCTYDPNRGEVFRVTKGKGVTLNGKRLPLLRPISIQDAIIGIGLGYHEKKALLALRTAGRLRGKALGIRMDGCASLDLAYVAAGRLACFLHPYLKIWDRSAGELMVKEAGGTIVDIEELGTNETRCWVAGGAAVVNFVKEALMAEIVVVQRSGSQGFQSDGEK